MESPQYPSSGNCTDTCRQTGMLEIIDAFRGYANTPKMLLEFLGRILGSRIQVCTQITSNQASFLLFFYVSSKYLRSGYDHFQFFIDFLSITRQYVVWAFNSGCQYATKNGSRILGIIPPLNSHETQEVTEIGYDFFFRQRQMGIKQRCTGTFSNSSCVS